MDYWTILWVIAIGGPLDGVASHVVYPSLEACLAAHIAVSDTVPYDHKIECRETPLASAAPRPVSRPER